MFGNSAILRKIITEKAVLVSGTGIVNIVKSICRGVDLYQGQQSEVFGLSGYLLNKMLSRNLFKDINKV